MELEFEYFIDSAASIRDMAGNFRRPADISEESRKSARDASAANMRDLGVPAEIADSLADRILTATLAFADAVHGAAGHADTLLKLVDELTIGKQEDNVHPH